MAAFEKETTDQIKFVKEQFWSWLQNNVPNNLLDGFDWADLDPSWFMITDPENTSNLIVRKKFKAV